MIFRSYNLYYMFNEFVVSKSQNTEILRVTTFSMTAPNVVAQFMFPAKE